MSVTSRSKRLAWALLLGAALDHGALAHAQAESAARPPLLAVDPLRHGVDLEVQECALPHWVERGFDAAVLVHIDAHDNLREIAPEKMAALRTWRAGGGNPGETKGCSVAQGRFDDTNFLRAAAGLGVLKEIVWVLPLPISPDDAGRALLLRYLGQAGFSRAERDSFRPDGGLYRGVVGGVPVTLCSQERLPRIAEPVLLSVDADFVLPAAGFRALSPLSEIRVLFKALREAHYLVRDVAFSYSVQRGYLPVVDRWVGDALLETLRNPAFALDAQPPERWRDLQHLSALAGRGTEAEQRFMNAALSLLELQPHDPAFLFYAAVATAGHGGDMSLRYAEEACSQQRGYCLGLRQLGVHFFRRGDLASGERFFAAGERAEPGSNFGQLERGIALLEAGRPAEALAVFAQISAREGAYPIQLLVGEVHLAAGDRGAARRAFDQAVAALNAATSIAAPSAAESVSLARAAAFYREEGLEDQARALEGDPRLRAPDAGEER